MESDKENENGSFVEYSAIDEDPNENELLREAEQSGRLTQFSSKMNQAEERKRKTAKLLSNVAKETNFRNANGNKESDKENESGSLVDYSAIDEDSNESELLREAEQSERLTRLSSKTNQTEERRRKVYNKLSPSVAKEMNVRNRVASGGVESDKENESGSIVDYSAVDEDSNESELIRETEQMGTWWEIKFAEHIFSAIRMSKFFLSFFILRDCLILLY